MGTSQIPGMPILHEKSACSNSEGTQKLGFSGKCPFLPGKNRLRGLGVDTKACMGHGWAHGPGPWARRMGPAMGPAQDPGPESPVFLTKNKGILVFGGLSQAKQKLDFFLSEIL